MAHRACPAGPLPRRAWHPGEKRRRDGHATPPQKKAGRDVSSAWKVEWTIVTHKGTPQVDVSTFYGFPSGNFTANDWIHTVLPDGYKSALKVKAPGISGTDNDPRPWEWQSLNYATLAEGIFDLRSGKKP